MTFKIERYTTIDVADETGDYALRFTYVSKTVNVYVVAQVWDAQAKQYVEQVEEIDVFSYCDEPTDIRNVEIDCVDYFNEYMMNSQQVSGEDE